MAGINKCCVVIILIWGILFSGAPFTPLTWPGFVACCIVLCGCCGGEASDEFEVKRPAQTLTHMSRQSRSGVTSVSWHRV